MRSEKGIALVQVLIISLVLSVLSMFVLQSTKHQISLASLADKKLDLKLALETAEAKLLESLVSYRPYRDIESSIDIVKRWRFDNKPFLLGSGVTVKIQDMRSLINLNYANSNLLNAVLMQLGLDSKSANIAVNSLADWIDQDNLIRGGGAESQYYRSIGVNGPRNNYLQSLLEVKGVRGFERLSEEMLEEHFTLVNQIGFNPMNASQLVLEALLNDDKQVKRVIQLREQGTLNALQFQQFTGLDADEFLIFATGGYLRVQLEINKNETSLKKSFVIRLRPASRTAPIVISEVKWN